MNIKIAVVCSSNQNRSMEAHNFLSKRGFDVQSFGSGTHVKLPGSGPHSPNIYNFGTPYEEMIKDLNSKDRKLYTENGLLHMLDRNRRIKRAPERFQDCKDQFDVIISCEERVYDQIIEGNKEGCSRSSSLEDLLVNIHVFLINICSVMKYICESQNVTDIQN